MKITVHSSKAVKPAQGGGLVGDVVPLSVFDKANFDTYVSVIFAFRPPSPPNAVLEAGLAKALAEYREWAGRLGVDGDGSCAILLNDTGARFVEATADVALDSVMPVEPTPQVLSLHPSGNAGAEELLLIQVKRFACGSLVVGCRTHHLVSDSRATTNFFLAWSQATRGAAIVPDPVHDRVFFFRSRYPPQVEHAHRGTEFKPYREKVERDDNDGVNVISGDDDVVINKVHFSREFIWKLKSQASSGSNLPYSTAQCVVAHLWRCMTVARGLDGRVATSVCIAVDGRSRMRPPVPEGYTGNVVLWARPTTTARELVTETLHHTVELINRELARIDDGYFKSFIDFASSDAMEERLVPWADPAMVHRPNIEVVSWLQIPFHDLDFGSGRPLFLMPSFLPVEGLITLLPSIPRDGGVDAYVPLFNRHMDTFRCVVGAPALAPDRSGSSQEAPISKIRSSL